jgi:sec-independent protein translocase protein TatA
MPEIGVPELLIILAIVVVLFGATRLADVGGALGRGIRDFRKELREDVDADGDNLDAAKENEHRAAGK